MTATRLTPRGERLAEAVSTTARTLAWSLVAFFCGLALATAFVQGQARECRALTAAASPTAQQHCPPAGDPR